MPNVSKEEIASAREMDLLTYLRAFEPDELVRFKVIQDVLGHADVSTTMNIYVDVTNELKKNELKSFSAYMEGA